MSRRRSGARIGNASFRQVLIRKWASFCALAAKSATCPICGLGRSSLGGRTWKGSAGGEMLWARRARTSAGGILFTCQGEGPHRGAGRRSTQVARAAHGGPAGCRPGSGPSWEAVANQWQTSGKPVANHWHIPLAYSICVGKWRFLAQVPAGK